MNLHTMQQINLNVHGVAGTLFNSNKTATTISEDIAKRLATTPHQAEILLDLVIGLALRELSIIVDYAQLNSDEIAQWLSLQPQFLHLGRLTDTTEQAQTPIQHLATDTINDTYTPAAIDVKYWQSLLAFTLPTHDADVSHTHPNATANADDSNDGLPSYAKAIGRTQTPKNPAVATTSTDTPTTNEPKPLAVQFASMNGIHIPYRRWLLQLAQVAEVYLSRQRLKINDEPDAPPPRPLVNFGFLEESRPLTASETPFEFDKPTPFYKNPVILLTIVVIGGLLLLAMLKYQQRTDYQPTEPTTLSDAPSQDVMILRMDDEDNTTKPVSDNKTDGQSKDKTKDAKKDKN